MRQKERLLNKLIGFQGLITIPFETKNINE